MHPRELASCHPFCYQYKGDMNTDTNVKLHLELNMQEQWMECDCASRPPMEAERNGIFASQIFKLRKLSNPQKHIRCHFPRLRAI
jgi:hypothetical protein